MAANVRGRVSPVTLKPAPVTLACEMVTLARLPLMIETDLEDVVLVAILPKLIEDGLRASRRVRVHGLMPRGAFTELVTTNAEERVADAREAEASLKLL